MYIFSYNKIFFFIELGEENLFLQVEDEFDNKNK
jgi:hypothetical protein